LKVLHYKTNFLNPSETFIDRLIRNHRLFEPYAMCISKRHFCDHLKVFQQPKKGWRGLINTTYFHLNFSLPFYKKVVKQLRPDIIHAHFGFDGFRMYRVAKATNTPLIVSFYGSDVSRLPTELGWKRRYKKLSRNAQAFVAASDLMKKQLIDLGFPEEKIFVIRFGINIDNFCFNHDYPSDPKLLMVGRMVEKKGFKYALQAIEILKNNNKTVEIDLLGDGPLREELHKITDQLGLTEQVHFRGYVSNEKVCDALQTHSILLAPSVTASDGDKEGLPNTVLEAMASGLPVIASDHAAISEAIINKKTGFLVSERSPHEIASAINTILNNSSTIEPVRQRARRLIEQEYSVIKLVGSYENLYIKVIENR